MGSQGRRCSVSWVCGAGERGNIRRTRPRNMVARGIPARYACKVAVTMGKAAVKIRGDNGGGRLETVARVSSNFGRPRPP